MEIEGIEIVKAAESWPDFFIGRNEERCYEDRASWTFYFRATISDPMRGIFAKVYKTWVIRPGLRGRQAAVKALAARAVKNKIVKIEIYESFSPQDGDKRVLLEKFAEKYPRGKTDWNKVLSQGA